MIVSDPGGQGEFVLQAHGPELRSTKTRRTRQSNSGAGYALGPRRGRPPLVSPEPPLMPNERGAEQPCRPDVGHERFGVVVLVASDGPSSLSFREPPQHLLGIVTLRVSGCFGEVGVDDQPVVVLEQKMPRVERFAAVLFDFRYNNDSGSVADSWVSFDRFWPCHPTSLSRPFGPSPSESFSVRLGLNDLCDAHASNGVPSTEKWSDDTYLRSFAWRTTAAKNSSATCLSRSRWRFLESVDASKDGASIGRSRNHFNNMP